MGRDLSDEQRQKRSVEAYANKCFSAFYGSVDDKKTLKTFDVFLFVANCYPKAACIWLARLDNITEANILDIFNRVNSSRISPMEKNERLEETAKRIFMKYIKDRQQNA